jgi:hypothetical protein
MSRREAQGFRELFQAVIASVKNRRFSLVLHGCGMVNARELGISRPSNSTVMAVHGETLDLGLCCENICISWQIRCFFVRTFLTTEQIPEQTAEEEDMGR